MRKSALVLLAGLLLGACGNPCQQVADRACRLAGDDSEECQQARQRAKSATSRERRHCEVALELVRTLEQNE